jgi:hypothetical protein
MHGGAKLTGPRGVAVDGLESDVTVKSEIMEKIAKAEVDDVFEIKGANGFGGPKDIGRYWHATIRVIGCATPADAPREPTTAAEHR